ncbi:MAG: 4-hydroxy-3-methylbut-2-enyl diphosphate reductase [Candidatus Omnitrophota bacterium]|nr:4-hydroxy-3-methylbut-2-enyl diphosphate reductase [Candidatus Omnitrophota bacterium]
MITQVPALCSPIKINLAKSAGFCFGVQRALDIAFKLANSGKTVYMLGDIVHNEDVVKQIENAGIKKIKQTRRSKAILFNPEADSRKISEKLVPSNNKTLLIRAHGAGLAIIKKARGLDYKIIDATCPMVKEIHRIVRHMDKKGYQIIVIGDKKHDEVQGIIGQVNQNHQTKTILFDPDLSKARKSLVKTITAVKKACVVVQSTQELGKVLEIIKILKTHIADLKFFNTICKPTRIKQEEIKKMPLENDIMLIIGSKNSANTKRLYEISKSKNKKSYWINSKTEIRQDWFKNAKNVGIHAGASTPKTTIKEVIEKIRHLIKRKDA